MQKPSKKAKNTAAGTNILPQKAKVLLFPPPPPAGNLPFVHAWARVEVATTQDNMEDLSWEKDDDNLLCGVWGAVETAPGFSILGLAVSGPEKATSVDDQDDS